MSIKEWWANIKNWMIRTETYLIWGMFFILEASDDYCSFNKIIHGGEISSPEESDVELFNVKITGISSKQDDTYYRYITIGGFSESMPLDDIIAEIEQSDGFAAISGLESIPSFLVKEEQTSFWKTHYTFMLMFKYGGCIAMCLFFGAFLHINLKRNGKLLTKEIERLIQGAFFLFLFGYIAYDLLNRRLVNFLIDEFYFSASAGALSSNQMYFVVMALLLAYIIIAKATPVQEEKDLTV